MAFITNLGRRETEKEKITTTLWLLTWENEQITKLSEMETLGTLI